jgi:hypothetical protein
MNELPSTKYILDIENSIKGSQPAIERIDQNSINNSTKNELIPSKTIRNILNEVQKGKPRVLKTSKLKKPKAMAVNNTKKTPIPKQIINQSQPKKPQNEKTMTSVTKKLKAKVTKTSQVQGTIKKSKATESVKKSLVKEPLGQPLSLPSPKSQLKKITPNLPNLISVVKNVEVKNEKPKRILKSTLKSDVKGKTPKQSEGVKPGDNNQK